MVSIVNNKKKPNLGNENCQLIYQKLFAKQRDDGSLPKGVLLNVGKEFGVTRQSMESNHLRLAIGWPTY